MDYIEKLVKHYGTQAQAARAIGLTPQAISQFVRRGSVPVEHQIRWEIESGGAVRAPDIPEALRCKCG